MLDNAGSTHFADFTLLNHSLPDFSESDPGKCNEEIFFGYDPCDTPSLKNGLLDYWPLNETSRTRSGRMVHGYSKGFNPPPPGYNLAATRSVGTTKGPYGAPCAAFRQSGSVSNTQLTTDLTGTKMTIPLN